jgi:hypothetical protein
MESFQGKLMKNDTIILDKVTGKYKALAAPQREIEGEFFHQEILGEGMYTLILDNQPIRIALFPNGTLDGLRDYKFLNA